jgi:metallo-beta-lactamase family protein
MKVKFFGAARTVTGSQVQVCANKKTILIDCGMFQGRRQETYERNKNFLYDPAQVDQLLLSHSHIDHSGNIPNLVKKGFAGSIYATPAAIELCKIMLRDSAYLQQKDMEWVNKIRARKNEPPVEPLYTLEDAEACMDMFVGVDFNKEFSVGPGITAHFRDAGHILGSASVVLEVEEHGAIKRIGYTGDIGRPNMPLTRDPNQIRDLDCLIMESTYGNRLHSPFVNVEEELAQLINDTARNGGKILIPSFAVGRTQLLVYILHKLYDENRIPDIPIFVDSPMALKATAVFNEHLMDLDRETQRQFISHSANPFEFGRLKYVETVDESKTLNTLSFPHVMQRLTRWPEK